MIYLLLIFAYNPFAQTAGVFGGDYNASGYPDPGNTKNKWIKMGEFILNGPYSNFVCTIDLFPKNSNHGDSRQQINIGFRNSSSDIEASYGINLITFYGAQKTVKDVKVIHTSGSGTSNNAFSIWIQIGTSWLVSAPLEYRYYENSGASHTLYLTNQPYYSSIYESGTTYDLTSYYGYLGNTFTVAGNLVADEVKVQADNWPDHVFSEIYQLPSLDETENYIHENHHLPGIPSTQEVKEQGISLGEMNVKLLEKIEELTLHLIEKEKQYQNILRELNSQSKEIEHMKDWMSK